MRVRAVMSLLDTVAPPGLAEAWDSVGLQVGDPDTEANGCLLCLDVTASVIGEARQCGASLIIAHHPLILEPLAAVTEACATGRTILAAARTGVSVFVAHTNLDASLQVGTAAALAERLGLAPGPALLPRGDSCEATGVEGVPAPVGEPADARGASEWGLGMVCEVPEMTLGAFVQYVGPRLGLREVCWVGETKRAVRRVALLPGSGSAGLETAAASADVLLTGELKYHDARRADDLGLAVVLGGHYATERPVLNLLARYLKHAAPTLQVAISQLRTDPFQTVPA